MKQPYNLIEIRYPGHTTRFIYSVVVKTLETNPTLLSVKGYENVIPKPKSRKDFPKNLIVTRRAWWNPMRFFLGKTYLKEQYIVPKDWILDYDSHNQEFFYRIDRVPVEFIVPSTVIFIQE